MVMFPTEGVMPRYLRTRSHLRLLEDFFKEEPTDTTLDVMCLQEVNPLHRRLAAFRQVTHAYGYGFEVNVGVRLGDISYPLFLQDGLGILWRGNLQNVRHEGKILSGTATEARVPVLKTPVTLQLAERRGAQMIEGTWAGKRFVFANLHLHNGPSTRLKVTERRTRETEALMHWLEPRLAQADVAFIAGDFNCEKGAPELVPLVKAGFDEILSPSGAPLMTWDPQKNPHAQSSVAKARDEEERAWDSRLHQIDHIFYRARPEPSGTKPSWTFRIQTIAQEPNALGIWPSDHYGLLAEIQWAESAP